MTEEPFDCFCAREKPCEDCQKDMDIVATGGVPAIPYKTVSHSDSNQTNLDLSEIDHDFVITMLQTMLDKFGKIGLQHPKDLWVSLQHHLKNLIADMRDAKSKSADKNRKDALAELKDLRKRMNGPLKSLDLRHEEVDASELTWHNPKQEGKEHE